MNKATIDKTMTDNKIDNEYKINNKILFNNEHFLVNNIDSTDRRVKEIINNKEIMEKEGDEFYKLDSEWFNICTSAIKEIHDSFPVDNDDIDQQENHEISIDQQKGREIMMRKFDYSRRKFLGKVFGKVKEKGLSGELSKVFSEELYEKDLTTFSSMGQLSSDEFLVSEYDFLLEMGDPDTVKVQKIQNELSESIANFSSELPNELRESLTKDVNDFYQALKESKEAESDQGKRNEAFEKLSASIDKKTFQQEAHKQVDKEIDRMFVEAIDEATGLTLIPKKTMNSNQQIMSKENFLQIKGNYINETTEQLKKKNNKVQEVKISSWDSLIDTIINGAKYAINCMGKNAKKYKNEYKNSLSTYKELNKKHKKLKSEYKEAKLGFKNNFIENYKKFAKQQEVIKSAINEKVANLEQNSKLKNDIGKVLQKLNQELKLNQEKGMRKNVQKRKNLPGNGRNR